jgi:predicted TPR repeat methyltransferase/TolA-binding protein
MSNGEKSPETRADKHASYLEDWGWVYSDRLGFQPENIHSSTYSGFTRNQDISHMPASTTSQENASFSQVQGECWVSYVDRLIETRPPVSTGNVLLQQVAAEVEGSERQGSGLQHDALNENISPTGPARSRVGAVVELYRSGEIDQALLAMTDLVTEYPEEALLWNIRGSFYANSGQFDHAIENFEQTLLVDPKFSEAHCNLGLAFKNLDQLDRAVHSYEQALKIRPDFAEAHYNLANTLKDLKRSGAAVHHYDRALKYKPIFPEAYKSLGAIFEKLGQIEDASANYSNAGGQYADLGQLDEALMNFSRVLEINPTYADALFNCGAIQSRLGLVGPALENLKHALELDPENHMALHIFNALSGTQSESAPRGYVETLFDGYADNFEHKLVSDLGYDTPSQLKTAYLNSGLDTGKVDKAVDLGCGTGLAGAVFRGFADELYGIDLSAAMIGKARDKKIYDRLCTDDLISGLEAFKTRFDLFVAADVFVYVGNLEPLLRSIVQHANAKAPLIFSTEDESGEHYTLQRTGRFSHSYKYVTRVASSLGFRLEHFEHANLRKEKGKWIIGGIYILQSP